MSDYLNNLVAKSLNRAEVVEPRLASRFEPPRSMGNFLAGGSQTDLENTRDERFIGETPSEKPLAIQTPGKNSADARPPRSSLAQPASAPAPTPDGSTDQQTGRHSSPLVGSQSDTPPKSAAVQEKRLPPVQDRRRVDNEPAAMPAAPAPRHFVRTESLLAPEAQLLKPASAIPQDRAAPLSSAAPSPAEPAGTQESAPTIKITIGRVDVRAITPAQPTPRRAPATRGPALSLDDYLKQRSGGQR